jgi:hypothetical protein
MAIERRELYRSSNHDRWNLARDTDSGHIFVQHQANASSGGNIEDLELGSFLNGPSDAPERRALMLMLAELFGNDAESESISEAQPMSSTDEFGS